MSQGSVLFDALSSAFWKKKMKKEKKKKERKGRNSQVAFSQSRHALLAVLHRDFPGC
jgi:hypothetical protein